MTEPKTYIYFLRPIGLLGPIKVGCSTEPKRRLEDLLTWSPLRLEIVATMPGTLKDEGFLHRCFAKSHSHREWFHPSPEIQLALTTIFDGGGIAQLRAILSEAGSIRTKRRPWSIDTRQRVSYGNRIAAAGRRLRAQCREAPEDISGIMSRWQGRLCFGVQPIRPTTEEFSRLDEFLINPSAHSVEFKPALRAVA